MNELVITNGDSTADLIKESGIGTTVLPWRDVLHEGPISEIGGLECLAPVRARYLSGEFGLDYEQVLQSFNERNEIVKAWKDFDRITLWFEHDLYDQLQILEILASFEKEETNAVHKLHLVQASSFLGHMSVNEIQQQEALLQPIEKSTVEAAAEVWKAFCSKSPHDWQQLSKKEANQLPYLQSAMHRQLEELPDLRGVTRTERQILELLSKSSLTPLGLFKESQAKDEAAFMGDWSFFNILERMSKGPDALVSSDGGHTFTRPGTDSWQDFDQCSLNLTSAANQLLEGGLDCGPTRPSGWVWGQPHINGAPLWRWDNVSNELVLK